ncbi:MAG: hypothetical protein OXI33_14355 [Chloroflexota bacterium]|nr:hypothetical protein [Chloroflexota bacterium]
MKQHLERVAQLIPAEVVAAHLAIQGLVYNQITIRDLAIELSAGVLLVLLPFYLRARGVTATKQIVLTMGSFVAWVLAVSLPVHQRSGLDPLWGSIVLILWSVVAAVAAPKAAGSSPDADDEAASERGQEG